MTSLDKHKIMLVLTILVCIFMLSASTSGAATLLKLGSSGPEVTVLQQQMQKLGYFNYTPTGYYDEKTRNAVSKMQTDYNLTPDGIAGTQTKYLISRLSNFSKSHLKRAVLGFYVSDEPDIPSSMATLKAQQNKITSLSPFLYRLDRHNPENLELYEKFTQQEINQVINFAQNKYIKNYALIHNMLYGKLSTGKDLVHTVMSEPNKRWALVMNVFYLLKSKDFDGVCIDIENIYPGDRGNFVQFLKALSAQLKPAGYTIVVSVPPKTSDVPNGGWCDNFNYSSVGQYADLVVIMAYDEHGSYSGPGPIASIGFVNNVVKYAVSKLPPEKVLLGIPGYGFDWNLDQKTNRYLSYRMAMETARQHNKSIQWDYNKQVPYYQYYDQYGSRHSVYFENASSLAAKLDVVNNYNLKGIAIWRLGMEDPRSWDVISGKFGPVAKTH